MIGRYGARGKVAVRKYSKRLIEQVAWRYITHNVLGYLKRGEMIPTLAAEFGLSNSVIMYILEVYHTKVR